MERVVSLFGLFAMMGFAWLLSSNKRRISLRVVGGGIALQFLFAGLTLHTRGGRELFRLAGNFFTNLLNYVDAGSSFVFGREFTEHFFAFKVLSTIVFFSSLMSVLYYLGIMQWIINVFAIVMQATLRTSGAESLSAAANIFVGQTEAPLVVRPYVQEMTDSELMSVMVGGFATVAGGVLAAYVGMGINASHLLTASVISAPAALLIAKIIQPEIHQPKTLGRVEAQIDQRAVNLIHAASIGAADGVKLALNVGGMLIAFLALIAMADGGLGWIGERFGQEWSLELALGYAFAPFAWLMGVEWKDCMRVGELLGLKMVANEFVAYERLARWIVPGSDVSISERSQVIATYALCGFANFGSIGIQIGGIGGIAPDRQADLARLGFRAMLGGTLAAFMTACVAGVLL